MSASRAFFLLLMLMSTLLAAACLPSNRVPMKMQYYILDYASPQVQVAPKQGAIMVEDFSVAPAFNTVRMVHGKNAYQVSEYNYHFWRANPGEMLASFLLRDIRDSGLFRAAVDQMDVSMPVDYRLSGSVDEFLENENSGAPLAVVAITVSLLRENARDMTKMLVFQKTYRAEKPCRDNSPEAVAEAMSLAVQEISGELIADINHSL